MAVAKALSKYIRISPFKVRRIANEIKGMDVLSAESYLTILPNKGALALKKVIHSARTNYIRLNQNVNEEDLIIYKILINSGSTMKRMHPISRGRAVRILKRTCHIYAEIKEREKETEKEISKNEKEKKENEGAK